MTVLSTEDVPRLRCEITAQAAMRRSRVTVLEISTAADAERAAELLRTVWRGPQTPVPANLLRAVQHTGGYVYGAYDQTGTLVAVSMGLLATEGLHSHITGVAPTGQRRGLGYALKQHQRCWAMERSMSRITWTCDPLVRRNVAFNLHALGATAVQYLVNHYGAMDDDVNKGDESDRFEVHWELASPAAVAAGDGRLPFVDAGDRPAAVSIGPAGLPVVTPVEGATRLVQLPGDIEALRHVDESAGTTWRSAVRDAVVPALSAGAAVRGLTSTGHLVLDTS